MSFFQRLYEGYYPEEAAQQEQLKQLRAQNARFLDMQDARAELGIGPDRTGAMRPPLQAPTNATATLNLDDITGGVSQGQMQVPTQAGADFMARQRALGGRAFPDAAAAAMQAKMFPAQAAPVKVDAGGSLVLPRLNPATGKYEVENLYNAPFKPENQNGSDLMRDAALMYPNNPAKQIEMVNQWRTKPGTSITIGGDKAVTKADGGRYERTTESLDKLNSLKPGIDRMLGAITAGAKTGYGQDWLLPLKQAAEEITGNKIEGTDEQEVFRSVQNALGPAMRTAGSGSSSDRDVSLYLDALPGMAKSESGNFKIGEYYDRITNRKAQEAQIQQDLLRQFDYIPIDKERAAIAKLGPLFSSEEADALKAFKAAPKSPAPGTTSQGAKIRVFNSQGKLEP